MLLYYHVHSCIALSKPWMVGKFWLTRFTNKLLPIACMSLTNWKYWSSWLSLTIIAYIHCCCVLNLRSVGCRWRLVPCYARAGHISFWRGNHTFVELSHFPLHNFWMNIGLLGAQNFTTVIRKLWAFFWYQNLRKFVKLQKQLERPNLSNHNMYIYLTWVAK